jgi:hypothetical protein
LGLKSNTFSLETPVKISPFVSVSPFYRYYSQTAAKYFAPYQQHTAFDDFYTSNYDLSKFTVIFTEQESGLVQRMVYLGLKD